LHPFFALSAAIALNTRLRICLNVATPFDRMACKVKSWLSQLRLEGGTLVPRARDQPGLRVSVPEPNESMTEKTSSARAIGIVIGILVLVIALLWKRLLR